MLTNDRTSSALAVLLGLMVLLVACAALIAYRQRDVAVQIGTRLVSLGNPAYEIQRDAIESYLRNAQIIQRDFGARLISRNETLRRALALIVPPVLKERHLRWVTAVRNKQDAVAAIMIQEYAVIVLTEK